MAQDEAGRRGGTTGTDGSGKKLPDEIRRERVEGRAVIYAPTPDAGRHPEPAGQDSAGRARREAVQGTGPIETPTPAAGRHPTRLDERDKSGPPRGAGQKAGTGKP